MPEPVFLGLDRSMLNVLDQQWQISNLVPAALVSSLRWDFWSAGCNSN